MEMVAGVLLVVVGQGPVDSKLLGEVDLAIEGLKRTFGGRPIAEFDEAVASAGPAGLVLLLKGRAGSSAREAFLA